jgi:hypothetical protein
MTAKEALKFINESAVESKKKLDVTIHSLHDAIDKGVPGDIKLDVRTFESIMVDVIKLKWAQQYPKTFLTCYVTGDEYKRVSKAPYTYYMKTINGSLKEFMSLNELDDVHMLSDDGKYTDENRLKMHKKRLEVIEELFNNVEIDIIAWCVDNVCI